MNVYQKLITVQSKLKAPKSQYNSFGKYNYRNCEDILEALKPLLSEVGATVIISDSIEKVDNRFYVKATVMFIDTEAEGGTPIMASAYAREEDSKKGMDGSQVTGATSSYARKYALNGLFAIDDTKDADFGDNRGDGDKAKATGADAHFDASIQYATKEQTDALTQAYGARLGEFLAKVNVSDIKLLPFKVAEDAIAKLEEYYKKKKGA